MQADSVQASTATVNTVWFCILLYAWFSFGFYFRLDAVLILQRNDPTINMAQRHPNHCLGNACHH